VFYRSRKWYFGEHAVTALYFLSFTSLLSIVRWPFWLALGSPVQGARAYEVSLVFLMITFPWKTATKSALVYGGTQLTIIVTTTLSFALAILHTVLVR
jgi:hypothetical protein